MRRHPSRVVAGLAMVLAVALATVLAGCGEDPQLESGVFPFKGTDTSSLAPLRDDMIRRAREKMAAEKTQEPNPPDAEPKPTGESEPSDVPKPAGSGPPLSTDSRGDGD